MKREPAWRRYLRFWGPDPAGDVDDELQFHLQTKTEDLMAAGMAPDEARREARRQFGPVRAVRAECHAIGKGRQVKAFRAEYFDGWFRDLRYAVRTLLKSRASSAAAVLILAVGIGASTAVFTLLDRLLLAPLPVPKPSELVLVSCTSTVKAADGSLFSRSYRYDAYVYLRDHNRTLAGLAAILGGRLSERRGGDKIDRPAEAEPVSGNFFGVLEVPPVLGRALTPSDDVAGAPRVAVASYSFWSRRYKRAAGALGQTVYLNGAPFTIVGMMPRGFAGLYKGSDPDLYVPLGSLPGLYSFDPLVVFEPRMFGRLKRGVSPHEARSDLQAGLDLHLATKQPSAVRPSAVAHVELDPGSRGVTGAGSEQKRSLMLVGAIVALLLLMGCLNVACLLTARGLARRHEIAIRFSLGAGKARIVRQSLIESCLLALAGGTAGLLVALWAERLLLVAFHWQDRPIDLSPDFRVLAFGLGVSLATGILFGLAPALQLLRGGRAALNQERTVAPRFASGKALVVVEVALSLAMVAGATVFIRSFQNLRSAPTGFSAEHVSVITLASQNPEDLYPSAKQVFLLADSLRGAPQIESVGAADHLTFNDGGIGFEVSLPEAPKAARFSNVLRVDGAYFDALQIPLTAGRTFTRLDDERAPGVAILAESTARRLFGDRSPLGPALLGGKTKVEIVGIVKDIKFTSVARPAPDVVFLPLLQGQSSGGAYSGRIQLQIRSRLAPQDVAAMVRARIRDQRLPVKVDSASALEDAIGASMLNDRIRMQASSLFGILALALISAGIYGLMTYSVSCRTREIGIRMAVGSKPWGIVYLVLKEDLRLVVIGVLIGLPGALAVMKAIHSMVFELAPFDMASLLTAALVLALTGIAAAVAPAWRAAHLDPVQALRIQ